MVAPYTSSEGSGACGFREAAITATAPRDPLVCAAWVCRRRHRRIMLHAPYKSHCKKGAIALAPIRHVSMLQSIAAYK